MTAPASDLSVRPSGDELARFAVMMSARLGLRIEPERSHELLGRRAASHRESIADYLDRVDGGDPRELRALIGELTVGETYFLRHIEQLRAFADLAGRERAIRGPLRVVSVGCSSGEEPYSLAIMLRESHPALPFVIHAIDLSAAAIARARDGRYSRWSLRAVPAGFEQRWFQADGKDVVILPEIRALVRFEAASALDAATLAVDASWDVIFCRNMIMYLTEERAETLIARFARALAPGGYLFLGHAESLRGRSHQFALCHTHGTFYYQRLPAAGGELVVSPSGPLPAGAVAAFDASWYDDICAATQRIHAMIDGALGHAGAAGLVAPAAAAPGLDAIRDLIAQDRFADALLWLDQRRAGGTGDLDIAMLRALVLTHSGQFADARLACIELLALDTASAGANYLLALCSDSTGDPDGAARLAQLAAELDPSFAMARVHLGLLARRSGDRALASRELTRAITLLELEPPARLALYSGGFSRQALLGMCRAELTAIGAAR